MLEPEVEEVVDHEVLLFEHEVELILLESRRVFEVQLRSFEDELEELLRGDAQDGRFPEEELAAVADVVRVLRELELFAAAVQKSEVREIEGAALVVLGELREGDLLGEPEDGAVLRLDLGVAEGVPEIEAARRVDLELGAGGGLVGVPVVQEENLVVSAPLEELRIDIEGFLLLLPLEGALFSGEVDLAGSLLRWVGKVTESELQEELLVLLRLLGRDPVVLEEAKESHAGEGAFLHGSFEIEHRLARWGGGWIWRVREIYFEDILTFWRVVLSGVPPSDRGFGERERRRRRSSSSLFR